MREVDNAVSNLVFDFRCVFAGKRKVTWEQYIEYDTQAPVVARHTIFAVFIENLGRWIESSTNDSCYISIDKLIKLGVVREQFAETEVYQSDIFWVQLFLVSLKHYVFWL